MPAIVQSDEEAKKFMLSILLMAHLALATRSAVEVDNAAVQVVRIRMTAHEKIPLHTVTPRVVVFLTDAHLKLTFADGTVREETWRRGQTGWLDQQAHAGENLSGKPIEFIAIIPKRER